MANISLEQVKLLREKTKAGMMDCKKALAEANGDMERAIEILRKRGAAIAAKRADNETNNGIVATFISPGNTSGVLAIISCETDFSANTEDMKVFSSTICEHIAHKNPATVEELLSQKLFNNEGISIQEYLDELISKIRESIKIEQFVRFESKEKVLVNSYIHPGANLGIIVELNTSVTTDEVKQLAKDICMQIAVTNPLAIEPTQLDKALVEKEANLIKEQLQESGKQADMIEKITAGKLQKFYKEVCLINQVFIKNDKQTIDQRIQEVAKNANTKIAIARFKRFAIGS